MKKILLLLLISISGYSQTLLKLKAIEYAPGAGYCVITNSLGVQTYTPCSSLSSTNTVQSVTGNGVDNTYPYNPIVTLLLSDIAANNGGTLEAQPISDLISSLTQTVLAASSTFMYRQNGTGDMKKISFADMFTYYAPVSVVNTTLTAGANMSITASGQSYTLTPTTSTTGLASTSSPTITSPTFSTSATFDYATATRVPIFNSSKQLISSSTTTTELTYLSGVTSSVQTQLDAKQNIANNLYITTGDQTTTSNVASNITGLVTPTLTINKRYYFEGFIHIGCNNTGGVKLQVTIPTGATMNIGLVGNNTSGTTTTWGTLVTSATLSTGAFTAQNNSTGQLKVSGEVQMSSTAGTVQFGFASTTNTQTSTIFQLGTNIK
jgi:hypothetical protein